jgi:predicted DNA-binding protein YlxM (UPF0122 family)
MALEIINYALDKAGSTLPLNELHEVFGHLLSRRQVTNFLFALERVGLADPADTTQVPRAPRELRIDNIQQAIGTLQYHPEITFHEEAGRLVFGPAKEGRGGVERDLVI